MFCVFTTAESRAKIWPVKIVKPPVASAAVGVKAVILVFIIDCLMLLTIFVRVL